MSAWTILCLHEMKLLWRDRTQILYLLGFFVILVTLYPLSLPANPELLMQMGSGVLWVAALLVAALATDHAFDEEYRQGILAQWFTMAIPLWQLVLIKMLTLWVAYMVPMVLISPLLLTLYQGQALLPLTLSLLVGSPLLLALGLLGNSLTLGLRHGRMIASCLILPLDIPLLILGAGTEYVVLQDSAALMAHLLMLAGLSLFLLPICTIISAMALRGALADQS